MSFTSLKFNLANSPIRRETLHGKQYIVAPMAMLTEGVHNGSGGPLLYTEDECKKATSAWNMKPIVVYHPTMNGKGVSACDPDVLEKQQVGMVMNTTWNGKLRADAWIEEDRARLVDNRVIDALDENKMMEISTGLYTDNVGTPGEWNGERYDALATNHQPDHLALLPDQIGACSIKDGAGLLQLNEAAQAADIDVTDIMAREMNRLRLMVGNAMSHAATRSAVVDAIKMKTGKDYVFIEDAYDDFVIYEDVVKDTAKLYKIGYTKKGDNTVELSGEPMEVVRVTEYRTVSGDFVGNTAPAPTTQNKESNMNKEAMVKELIDNAASVWGEGDREALMAMPETTLQKLAENDAALMDADSNADSAPAPEADAGDDMQKEGEGEQAPEQNVDEYINGAPAEMQDVLRNGLKAYNEQKQQLVGTITANASNKFTPEYLNTLSMDQLEGIAALAKTPTENTAAPAPAPAMFIGQGGQGVDGPTNNSDGDTPLTLPSMDFGSDS